MGKYQSGQLGQTVNLLTYVFTGSNPVFPTIPISSSQIPGSKLTSGSSSFGRAIAFQAIGGEFEPRLPLSGFRIRRFQIEISNLDLGLKCFQNFESGIRNFELISCCSSGVEHFLGKEEVESSILFNSSKPVWGFKTNLVPAMVESLPTGRQVQISSTVMLRCCEAIPGDAGKFCTGL
jgi:hypothetical protein